MDIYEEIRSLLREEWENGATQQQIADRAGVTNPYINKLLAGKRKVSAIKLETLFKLFPEAKLTLRNVGNRSIGNGNTITNARVQSDNNFLPGSEAESFRRKVIDAMIDLDISDADRSKVLKAVKSIEA